MELKEEMVSQQTVYEGIIVNVRRGELQDGKSLAGILKASFLLVAPQS